MNLQSQISNPPAATLCGVVATQPSRAAELEAFAAFTSGKRCEDWSVEAVENRGFVAVRSPGQIYRPDSSCHDGFTAARGFVYRQSERELALAGQEPDSVARSIHLAYRRYGRSFTARLDGQFRAVGFDRAADVFWMAVDTFGVSQLFYFEQRGYIHFSDDVMTLASLFDHRLRPCPHSLHAYFTLFQVPPPHTGFAGIRQLAANTLLVIEGRQVTIQTACWAPERRAARMTECEALDGLQTILEEKVALPIAQHRSPALLFSGGVDSSLLGAMLVRHGAASQVAAHAFGAEGSGELRIARQRAESLGLQFRAWPFPGSQAVNAETVTRRWKAPVFPFPAFYIDQFVSEVAQVSPHLVSGSGADGVFPGDAILSGLLREIESCARDRETDADSAALAFRQALPGARLFRQPKRFARRFLYTTEFNHAIGLTAPEATVIRAYLDHSASGGLIFQYLAWAHHSIIAMYARAAAGCATVHFPFLSKHLIEFALTLPPSLKLGGKPLLKKLLLRLAPSFPVEEPKRGFGHSIAIERWLTPELAAACRAEVLSSGLCDGGILRDEAVQAIFDECASPSRDPALLHMAWGIYSLAVWFRLFINAAR